VGDDEFGTGRDAGGCKHSGDLDEREQLTEGDDPRGAIGGIIGSIWTEGYEREPLPRLRTRKWEEFGLKDCYSGVEE
jgi:hypothetical protein